MQVKTFMSRLTGLHNFEDALKDLDSQVNNLGNIIIHSVTDSHFSGVPLRVHRDCEVVTRVVVYTPVPSDKPDHGD